MFNKLKQFKDLRSQAKTLQNTLAQETVKVERGGVSLVMDGNLKVKSLTINQNLSKESLEGILTDLINEAIKKTQKIMARKMQELGGFPGLT
jgi:DNA-binding protein YbaB